MADDFLTFTQVKARGWSDRLSLQVARFASILIPPSRPVFRTVTVCWRARFRRA
jgi:hypothetical protein